MQTLVLDNGAHALKVGYADAAEALLDLIQNLYLF